MKIAHVGSMRPVGSFADIAATVRDALAPMNLAVGAESPATVSVRLSQAVLDDPATTSDAMRAVLAEHGLRLAGFSGVGIGGRPKEHVHDPDWRTEERLAFMFAAANLAAGIAEPGDEIGITTTALSYRHWLDVDMSGNWAALTLNVVRVVQHLIGVRERTGITIHIDLEAEPGSVLRDTADIVRFFTTWLLPRGAAMLSDRVQLSGSSAAEEILRHVRIALDTAHATVVWDDAAASLDAFAQHGIRIGRLQVSSALEIAVPAEDGARRELAEHLGAVVNPVLLQQVVGARAGLIVRRWDDLPDAIAEIDAAVGETWRIHTHAPLLADRYGVFGSTRRDTAAWLREVGARGLDVGLIELRSANWDVVPPDDRAPLETMIAREAAWVRDIMQKKRSD